jgi:hypothetical protein
MKYHNSDTQYFWKKNYLNKYMIGIMGFSLMMPITIFLGNKVEAGMLTQVLFALLPVMPFIFAMYVFFANMKVMDEMWRKAHGDALIVTTFLTIALSLSLGMLQVMNVFQSISILYIFMFMIITWPMCLFYLVVKNKLL